MLFLRLKEIATISEAAKRLPFPKMPSLKSWLETNSGFFVALK